MHNRRMPNPKTIKETADLRKPDGIIHAAIVRNVTLIIEHTITDIFMSAFIWLQPYGSDLNPLYYSFLDQGSFILAFFVLVFTHVVLLLILLKLSSMLSKYCVIGR